jgi:hypothetical protein
MHDNGTYRAIAQSLRKPPGPPKLDIMGRMDNRELNSIIVPRLFVAFASARMIDSRTIAAVHDYLIADENSGFRLSGLNISDTGPAAMALFLCDYIQHPHVGTPTWFSGCGGIPPEVFAK